MYSELQAMSNNAQNTQRIARNTGYLYLRMIIVTLVNLYTSRIVLKALGFEDFGIYNIVASIIIFFSFFNNALKNATTRYLSFELGTGNKEKLRQIFSMSINLHLLLAIIIGVVLEIGGVWFLNSHLEISPQRLNAANYVFQFTLITFCVSMIQIPFDSCIIAHEKMNFYAVISIAEAVGKLGVAFAIMISPLDKLITYGGGMMLISILILAGYWLYCRICISTCFYIRFWNKRLIYDFASYSGWSLLVNTSDVVVIQGRAVLFNIILGVIANAALGIANQVYNALAMFARNFASAFNPQIYKSYASGDRVYFMQLIFSTSKLSYYLLILPLLPLLINLPFVLKIWLGDYPPLTPIYTASMMLFAVFDAFQAPLWNAIFATGKIRVHQIMMSIIKISILPLTWLVLYKGDNGVWAILVWGLGNALCAIVRTIYAKGFLGLPLSEYLRDVCCKVLLVTLLTIPLPLGIVYRFGQGWVSFVSSTVLSCLLLCAFVCMVGLNNDEKQQLQRLPIIKQLFRFRQTR